MNHRNVLFFFVVSLLLITGRPSSAVSADWSIPIGGNSFRTAPEPGDKGFRRDGTIVLSDSASVLSTYFHVNRPATLRLAIKADHGGDVCPLIVRVADQEFTCDVDADGQAAIEIGTVVVAAAGYVRVDFQLGPSSKEVRLAELLVSSDTVGLELDFVKNNDGNMFYWGRRGPSVHLRYSVPEQTDLRYAYCEITVPPGQDPIGSYFMANGFGEGYFGIQVNGASERRVLFSVWSPFKTDNPRDIPADQRVVALAKGPDVHLGEFGNEGSGGQSYLVYPWTAGTRYRFLTEVRPDEKSNTTYTSWFGEAPTERSPGSWRLIASFKRPRTDTHLRGFHSFLENFAPSTGHLGRRVAYSNVWVCDTNDQWHECTSAQFSVDATGGGRHRVDFTGGAEGDSFYLRNCGFFAETGRPGERFNRDPSGNREPALDFDRLPRE